MNLRLLQFAGSDRKVLFLRTCFWIGVAADLVAVVPLLFPEAAKILFRLQNAGSGDDYRYVSGIAASLMLGWTFLLAWGSFKPIERKGILLLTVAPVLAGLLISSVLAVQSGFIRMASMLPLWVFYALIIPLYVVAYIIAAGMEKSPVQ